LTQAETVFFDAVGPVAKLTQEQYKVPASITIAQAILESGWGRTGLALEANNYFGIKAAPGQDYAEFRTAEFVHGQRQIVMADFARYPSVSASFAAHAKLIATSQRYAPAMVASGDASAFATALQACGYSTSPTYASSLMQLVKQFNLTAYDGIGQVSAGAGKK
jgi:flagellum-specific peptidoglycan hydrolase FlgJ